jgi:hypothetical protein
MGFCSQNTAKVGTTPQCMPGYTSVSYIYSANYNGVGSVLGYWNSNSQYQGTTGPLYQSSGEAYSNLLSAYNAVTGTVTYTFANSTYCYFLDYDEASGTMTEIGTGTFDGTDFSYDATCPSLKPSSYTCSTSPNRWSYMCRMTKVSAINAETIGGTKSTSTVTTSTTTTTKDNSDMMSNAATAALVLAIVAIVMVLVLSVVVCVVMRKNNGSNQQEQFTSVMNPMVPMQKTGIRA